MRIYYRVVHRYRSNFHRLHLGFIVLLAIVVLYRLPSLSFMIGWDDQAYVINHFTGNGFRLSNIVSILTESFHAQYSPVNQLYYCLVFELFGYKPACFHLASAAIHLANSVLVYVFIAKVTGKLFSQSALKNGQVAAATAVLFLVAPINLEPTAWISASKVLLYGFFYLLSLISYIKYIGTDKSKYYYLVLSFFVLSFGAKEQAVTLPFAMLLIDYLYRRDFKNLMIWYEKAPMLILASLFALASLQSQGNGEIPVTTFYPLVGRILLSLYAITEYFTKIILPVNLSYLYPFPYPIGETAPLWLWLYPIIIPLVIYCLFEHFKKKWVFFGTLFFLVHIVLVSNIINLARFSFIADRYAYISSIGLFFMLSCAMVKFHASKRWSVVRLLMATTYILLLSAYTLNRSLAWKNAGSLKERIRTTIKNRPDYGTWYQKQQN